MARIEPSKNGDRPMGKKSRNKGNTGIAATSENRRTVLPSLQGRSVLYVGGRDCQVAHLRQIAEKHGAELIHHDGGLREAVSRIDTVLPSVECVFCPIDCISHDACLRVKTGCKKTGTAFVPLRNGSKSSFERAMQEISDRGR